jgi:hypothetical protein
LNFSLGIDYSVPQAFALPRYDGGNPPLLRGPFGVFSVDLIATLLPVRFPPTCGGIPLLPRGMVFLLCEV